MSPAAPLGSTYRLQLNGLGLSAAADLVGYLHELGVATLYVSPVTAAASGSAHGYDVVDPTRLDPALGTEDDLEVLLARLDVHGMRLLVDTVPNHMATSDDNLWWRDVLRHGRASRFAPVFDVDWVAGDDKVVLAVLDRPLAETVASGDLVVDAPAASMEEGVLRYGDRRLPLAPGTEGMGSLMDVLDAQHYRLVPWRDSPRLVNYRRFFDIDGLVGVRVEDPAVYARTHRFVLALARDRRVAGVRVDHVDGLADPAGYLHRLRVDVSADDPGAERGRAATTVVVEKILARDEDLPRTWPVDGATGYEFADVAVGLLVDADGAAVLEGKGEGPLFRSLATRGRAEVLESTFPGWLARLQLSLGESGAPAGALDGALAGALGALTTALGVYRTYITAEGARPEDRTHMADAVRRAGAGEEVEEVARRLLSGAEAVIPWQQLTSAVAAKGVEDTALYRFDGCLAVADVGSDPGAGPVSPDVFHAAMTRRAQAWPGSLNATSTHDAKRAEDARAVLAVLPEMAAQWAQLARRWHQRAADATGADGTVPWEVEAALFQAVAATWPWRPGEWEGYGDRIQRYAQKATREAKRHTSWTDPDIGFEARLARLVALLVEGPDTAFGRDMEDLAEAIGPAAVSNALALVVLKATAPGVPDVYQGAELWARSLVDPDNRRPVDFAARRAALRTLDESVGGPGSCRPEQVSRLLAAWRPGLVKMHVLRALLHLRRTERALFDEGAYEPLPAVGMRGAHAVGFARRLGTRWALTVVTRLPLTLAGSGRMPVGRELWGDTSLVLPSGAPPAWRDVLTGTVVDQGAPARSGPSSGGIHLGPVLDVLPVAVLVPAS